MVGKKPLIWLEMLHLYLLHWMFQVMIDEMEAIRAGIQNYADFSKKTGYKPKIVLLIAVKRHNKRFFVETANG